MVFIEFSFLSSFFSSFFPLSSFFFSFLFFLSRSPPLFFLLILDYDTVPGATRPGQVSKAEATSFPSPSLPASPERACTLGRSPAASKQGGLSPRPGCRLCGSLRPSPNTTSLTQRSDLRPRSDGSSILPGTALGRLIWRCGFLPAFPSSGSAAAAHFHWSE